MARKIFPILLTTIFLTGCGSSVQAVQKDLVQTQTAAAAQTQVVIGTFPPLSTFTPLPISSPIPTRTARSTWTALPSPTNAPVPPLERPETFGGSGNKTLHIRNVINTCLLYAKYDGSGNFVIRSYDSNGNQIDLVVNAVGPYEGTHLANYGPQTIDSLQVESGGPWTITFKPMSMITSVSVPGKYSGKNDETIQLDGGIPAVMHIDARHDRKNLAIWSFDTSFAGKLILDKTAPYTGQVNLSSKSSYLQIDAVGSWTLTISGQ